MAVHLVVGQPRYGGGADVTAPGMTHLLTRYQGIYAWEGSGTVGRGRCRCRCRVRDDVNPVPLAVEGDRGHVGQFPGRVDRTPVDSHARAVQRGELSTEGAKV